MKRTRKFVKYVFIFLDLVIFQNQVLKVAANVRRYACWRRGRGGACFCTRGAMQSYDVDLFILALAKTVTPEGARRELGRPHRRPLSGPPLQKVLAVRSANCIPTCYGAFYLLELFVAWSLVAPSFLLFF